MTDNDLGYGEKGFVGYGITLWEADTTLAEFSGNNLDGYIKGVIGSFDGNAATVAAKGNYLDQRPVLTRNLNRDGVVAEPVSRGEGDIGPRPSMTAESPPVVPLYSVRRGEPVGQKHDCADVRHGSRRGVGADHRGVHR